MVFIKTDSEGKSLGYGYVQYASGEHAQNCIQNCNQKDFLGRGANTTVEIFKAP